MKKFFLALAASAAAIASPASATWREASTKHFLIYSEQSEGELRNFASRLERYDSAMRADRGIKDSDRGAANRLTIFVVDSTTQVQKLAGDKKGVVAGFYDARAGASVAFMPRRIGTGGANEMDAEGILRHEYAHYFMFENFATLAFPQWFSEGFAEFNAGARVNPDGSVDLGLPALHRAYGLTRVTSLTMKDLLEPDMKKFTPAEGDAFYGRAWELTHMLTFDPKRSGQLGKFLLALNQGQSGIEAAKTAFGNLDRLEVDLQSYLKRASFAYKTIPAANVTAGEIAVRQLSAAENAAMPIKLVSKRGVDRKRALELVPKARQAAAPFPDDYAAQIMLAEAEFDAGNFAEADAAADRAMAANKSAVAPLLYKGYVAMERARAAKATDDATWRGVRRWFATANRLDPMNPQPLISFYKTFSAAGQKATPNAIAGLHQAYLIAPQDKELRLLAARQFLTDGDAARAREALGPLSYDPHSSPASVEFAQKVLEKLKTGGPAEALAEWERLNKEAAAKAAAAKTSDS